MKTIYIMLTYSGSFLSRLIKVWTKEPYSHVSIGLDPGLKELYSFGRKRPRNPIFAGFVQEDIINGTYGRFPKTECAVYSLDITDENYEKLLKEIDKFKSEIDKYGYNLLGLLGVMFNKPIHREYNYFCSQFVSEILQNSGIHLISKTPELIEPGDFRQCSDLQLEYEGYLRHYNNYLKFI